MSETKFTRPPLADALAEWKKNLAADELPTGLLWIFQENLCIEHSRATRGSFRIGFQTRFSPPDEDALEIAYDIFCETNSRIVFYRLGSIPGKSVCILLCDSWFEEKTARDGFMRRDDWGISFYPGHAGHIEEVTELTRWVRRVKRDRAFHDFDFCLSLATIDEMRTHGRPLLAYERFAQTMMNRLKRILGQE